MKYSIRFLVLVILLLSFTAAISFKVKIDFINYAVPEKGIIVDSIFLHFIHGSKLKDEPNCVGLKSRMGSYLGGHVEFEIDSMVFGFNYKELPIHILTDDQYNSNFECYDKSNWNARTVNDKITTFTLPISNLQRNTLNELIRFHSEQAAYDYAFFGQRCTSSAAEILSDAKIFSKFSNFESIVVFFYPRQLRNAVEKFAINNNLIIDTSKKGSSCYKWE